MQHLENDMDDLFQRAAENYPLQKGKDDWESIAKKISDNSDSPKVIPVQNKRNKKFIAFALLLLMLAVSWFIFQNTKTGRYADMKKTELKGTKSIPNNSEINNKKTGIAGKEQAFNINEKNKSDNQNNNKSITHSSANTSTNFTAATVKVSFYSKNNNANQNEEIAANNVVTEKNNASNNYFSIPHIIKENPGKVITEKQETISEDIPESRNNVNEHVSPPFLNNHSKENSNAVISEKKKQEKTRIQQKKQRIYIGIFAGPDFSKVQSGSFSHTGFDAGILLGVRVNRKISFETGFMWNKKNYNSDGKDFSMDKVGSTMPSGMVINNLKSQSSFIEIPIKIKYDFFVKSNSDLFVAGGLSSYIMTKEMNTYNVTLNGIQEKLSGVYTKNNYGLPAVANVSIGYEHSISKNLDIRIEPFLKIPLQGMGVGSLPVTSAGLQLGITGRLK